MQEQIITLQENEQYCSFISYLQGWMQESLHGSVVYLAICVLFSGIQAAFCLPLLG
jgi:hypothetical protein